MINDDRAEGDIIMAAAAYWFISMLVGGFILMVVMIWIGWICPLIEYLFP